MNLIRWQQFVLPVAVPLTISLAFALAGPHGPFGLSPDPAGEPTRDDAPALTHVAPGERDTPRRTDSAPAVAPTPGPEPAETASEQSSTPPPAVSVPAAAPTRPSPSPPPTEPTPAATPSPPTPTPVAAIGATEACLLARAYAVTEMETVTVEFKSCSAVHLDGRWEVKARIRNPACAAVDPTGQACPHHGLTLKFYVYESGLSVTAADEATALILRTY